MIIDLDDGAANGAAEGAADNGFFGAAAEHPTTRPQEVFASHIHCGRPFCFSHVSQQRSTVNLFEAWHLIFIAPRALAGAESSNAAPIEALAIAIIPVIFENLFMLFLRCKWVAIIRLHDECLHHAHFLVVSPNLILVSIVS